VSVWLTITAANAANGQGDDNSASAEFALRIQCARVEYEIEFIVSPSEEYIAC
jgi:hypothetical protein